MVLNKADTGTVNSGISGDTAKTKLWSKPYILNLIAIFAISITMTFFMPLLPIYIEMIGGSVSLAGLVVSIYTFAALVGRPFFAVLIDKYGRKPFLVMGLAFILAGCFFYRFIASIGVLLAIRVVHGIGYSAGSNAAATIAADVPPKERRSQGIGYYGFVTAASLALGPALGLLIMNHIDIKTAFAFTAVIAAVGLAAALFISYERKPEARHEQSDNAAGEREAVGTGNTEHGLNIGYEKTALPAALVMLLVAFAYSGIVTFLPAYAGTLGMHNISVYFITYAVVLLITRIIVDRFTKNRDISAVLLPGIALMAVAFVLLATGKTMPIFLAAAVFYAVGYGSVQPTLNAIVISLCAPSKRGAANSTFFSAMDLGIGLGALIFGVVSQMFGYSSVYFGCVGFMALAAAAYIILLKKRGSTAFGKAYEEKVDIK